MKVVVANSVGVDSEGYHMVHVPSRWSLGVESFTNCSYYPWELAYTSSLLKRETPHDIKMLDGVLNSWDFETYFDRLADESPDWLIMESSTRTITEDLKLANAAKKEFGTRSIMVGQHPMASPEKVLEMADFVCIGEYEYAVLNLIQGKDPTAIPGVYPNNRGELIDINSLPFPEDDDISRFDYHEPNCRYRQIQMYASRGCPRRCNFCAAATLYYDELNWRPRKIKNIVEEIKYLMEKYPEMEGVFFDEEVHNIRSDFNSALAQAIKAEGLDHLKYEAMCEYISLDKKALKEMKEAGYYKIRFGIETGSDLVAEKMTLGKKHNLKKLKTILEYGKSLGMLFYGTISIGGLGSNEIEDGKTVDLVNELAFKGWLDEIQVSINTPQPGTDFYRYATENSLLKNGLNAKDYDGNRQIVVEYPNYSAEQIQKKFDQTFAAFDKGQEKNRALFFESKAKKSFSFFPKNSKVLVMRCVRPWMVHLVLENLLKLNNIKPDILCQSDVMNDLKSHPAVGNKYAYKSGFFSEETISMDLVSKLRAINYDVIVIPMANNHFDGYKNVYKVAQIIKPLSILGIYPDGTTKKLS